MGWAVARAVEGAMSPNLSKIIDADSVQAGDRRPGVNGPDVQIARMGANQRFRYDFLRFSGWTDCAEPE